HSSHLISLSTTTHVNTIKYNQNISQHSMSHGYIPKTIKTLCSCTSCAALCFNPSIRLSTMTARQSNMFIGKNNRHYADYVKTTRAERLEMIRFEDSLQNLLLFSRK
ncbi:unnamed protein product, partial [Schistosoma turkestanicum]